MTIQGVSKLGKHDIIWGQVNNTNAPLKQKSNPSLGANLSL